MSRFRIRSFLHREPGSRRPTAARTGVALVAAAAMTVSVAACGGGSSSSAGATASDTVTIAVDSDAVANGYDALLYSQGQDHEDDRGDEASIDGAKGDLIIWPPVKVLARAQGLIE